MVGPMTGVCKKCGGSSVSSRMLVSCVLGYGVPAVMLRCMQCAMDGVAEEFG
jgi:hypothetical protein